MVSVPLPQTFSATLLEPLHFLFSVSCVPHATHAQAANMYSVRAYAIGYAVAELPYVLFITLAFCSIFYWITGLADSAEKFFFYW